LYKHLPGILVTVFALSVLAYFLVTREDSSSPAIEEPQVAISTIPVPEIPSATPGEAVVPTPEPGVVPSAPDPTGVTANDRIIIGKIGVNAPLVFLTMPEGSGPMPTPSGGREVAYYSFPYHDDIGGVVGKGGNAIFSGHVNLRTIGEAVFWDLHKLQSGDEIQVRVSGQTFTYRVREHLVESAALPANDEFYWNRLLASTQEETITLITCTGNFDPVSRTYDKRRVVKAVRVQ
jgi:LPXTG-site transpeptidase (sortase) family protein